MCHVVPGAILTVASALVLSTPVLAHGVVGNRFFPATLTIDDPFVADELSLPTVSTLRRNATTDEPSTRETEISSEFSKRITPDLGLSVEDSYRVFDPEGGKSRYGFGNVELSTKYQLFKSNEHETIFSAGLGFEIGGTGAERVDADRFNTVTPVMFFGKGFGDLPDSIEMLKPLAVTGQIGLGIPTSAKSTRVVIDPDNGEEEIETERHPHVLLWGFTLQYSLPYLQSAVRDIGLGPPFNRLIPIVEFAFESPLDRNGGGTTGTVSPGVIWLGQSIQIGAEAFLPINDHTGRGVGIIVQLHFYLDDLFPNSIGRPLFGNRQ